jgi:hypothetical protein
VYTVSPKRTKKKVRTDAVKLARERPAMTPGPPATGSVQMVKVCGVTAYRVVFHGKVAYVAVPED